MRKKRFVPWIHRWSRPIMAGLATIGAVGTAYLTVVKLTQGTAACPTGGCDVVLSSPYATVFGLPLTLFGFLGYFSMIVFAIFGKKAVAQLNYIECDPRGKDPKPELCQAAKIQNFPSWEIKVKFYQGTQSLEQLANLSAYQGQRNFQNSQSSK